MNIDDRECKSFNFHVSEKFGIVVDEKDLEHQQYRLTHEMTHFFIKYTLDEDHQLKERNLLLDEEKSRLYEGITESITQQTWKLMNPLEESVGSLEDLYLFECEISDILMETMNKKLFLKYIFENPNFVLGKIKSISYKNDNLLNYLDKQMKPLIFYRGEYDKDDLEDFDILDGFEAICDCGSQLKLGGELKKDENKSKRKW